MKRDITGANITKTKMFRSEKGILSFKMQVPPNMLTFCLALQQLIQK